LIGLPLPFEDDDANLAEVAPVDPENDDEPYGSSAMLGTVREQPGADLGQSLQFNSLLIRRPDKRGRELPEFDPDDPRLPPPSRMEDIDGK
jgi:hypothetical protein